MSDIKFNTIEEAIADFKAGKMVIAVDDDDLENEGSSGSRRICHTRSYQLYGNQCQRFDHYANF